MTPLVRFDESDAAVALSAASTSVVTIPAVAEIPVATIAEFAFATELPIAAFSAKFAVTAVTEIAISTGASATPAATPASAALVTASTSATTEAASPGGASTTPASAPATGGIAALFGLPHAQVAAAEVGTIQLGDRGLAEFPA